MHRFVSIRLVAGVVAAAFACRLAAQEPVRREFKVGDDAREALVVAPASAKSAAAPLVLVFHGHGGTAKNAAAGFAIHKHWPEAVVVYPQGLPTPGRLTDREGKKSGWQAGVGEQNDRDLKFFDAMIAALKAELKIDEKRVYSTGHSNGGSFTYILWGARGDVLAAVAPSAAPAPAAGKGLTPKPLLHIGAENDPLVKFEWQKRTIDAARSINGCAAEGKEHGKFCTLYESKTGTPVMTFLHGGGHKFPAEAPPVIVAFFKEHARK
jgi:polyhydroxybutyrate depolymerase